MFQKKLLPIALAAALAACAGGSSGPQDPRSAGVAYPTAADAYEGASGDDTAATASHIAVGEAQPRSLFPAGDEDWVAVHLEAGRDYEISANHLSAATDTYLFLFAPDAVTTLAKGDDYLDLDSMIAFVPTTSGTYYVRVTAYTSRDGTQRQGLGSYTLSVHLFVDADGDGWSSYYDCDDADSTVNPGARDLPGDGVDQDCDGVDALDATTVVDAFEPDGDPTHARPLAELFGDPWEWTVNGDYHAANARTLTPGDEDWVTVTVEAHGAIELGALFYSPSKPPQRRAFTASDLVTPVASGTGDLWLENPGETAQTFYVEFSSATATVFYVPFWYSVGVDRDGDGHFTRDWDGDRDCDDADAAIHPGATETPGDGVDSNCNGYDGT